MKRRICQSAFTLLELVLVMVIICVAVAMAAPSLSNWSRGGKLRNSGDQFLTLIRYGRSQAISDAVKYRIEFHTSDGQYQLKKQQGTDFVTIPGDLGKVISVPDGGKLELTVTTNAALKDDSDNKESIDFYPNGRTQAATVRIADGKGYEIEITCDSPAEDFSVRYEGTTRR
jgi:prepilin-type N-terminal cleavage/methylation domain-containing protein